MSDTPAPTPPITTSIGQKTTTADLERDKDLLGGGAPEHTLSTAREEPPITGANTSIGDDAMSDPTIAGTKR